MSTHIQGTPAQTDELSTRDGDSAELKRQIEQLGQWFHNLDLNGVPTAPDHFLGDFPNVKWKHISTCIPEDVSGATVLDIGCNGGFYSMEMKRRGASRVLGIDVDERYLSQARFAATTLGYDIEFELRSVYDVDQIPGQFDYVFFLYGGVLPPSLSAVRSRQSTQESARTFSLSNDDSGFGASERMGEELSLLE
jgi:SAM-dependent methyltransferase